jgi:hypothetical protein
MNRLIRNKILVQEIIKRGICSSQKELGVLLGYENESYFSQIMTGVKSPKNFILKLKSLLPDLNEDWLINGEGDMFLAKDDTLGIAIDDSTPDTSEQPTEDVVVISTQMLEEMTAQRQLTEQALALVQEQLEAKQETIEAVREQLATTQEQLTTSQEHLTTSQEQLTTSQEQLSAEQTQTNNALASLAKSIERIDKAQAQMDELILMLKKEQARQDHHLAQLEAEHKQSQQKPTQPQQGKKSQDA